MKKSTGFCLKVLLFLVVILVLPDAKAQSNWEIGARYGNYFAVDDTVPLKALRLHPAVYFDGDIAIDTYADWLISLNAGPTGLKFYPGIGPELYFYDGLDIAVAGNFGAEYSFEFPLTVGFDWRPSFMITNDFIFDG